MIILTDCLSDYSDEGSNRVAEYLIRQLKHHDPDTTIISFHRTNDLADLHLTLNALFLNRDLLSLLRHRRETVLYVPFSSNTRGAVLRTFLLSRFSKSRICALFMLRRPMDRLTRILLRKSNANVLCLSEEACEFYRSVVGFRAYYVKTGVDTLRFSPVDAQTKTALRQKYGIDPHRKVLLHVGHLKEGRNIRQLLNVDERFHVILVVSTQTKNERSRGLAEALASRPNITIIDSYLPDIQQLYQLADVYFFPVKEPENCIDVPLSVLEAAACALPVVTTPYGELRQFQRAEGFFFVDSFEPERLNPLLDRACSAACGNRSSVLPYDWTNAPQSIRHTEVTKVLHLMVSGGIGGIENLMKQYSADSVLHNHFAFLWGGGGVAQAMAQSGVPVFVMDLRKDGLLRTVQKILRLIRLEQYDAVISHHRAPLLKLILLWTKIHFPDIRTYAYAHSNARDICESSRPRALLTRVLIQKTAYLTADRVIAISNSVCNSLEYYLQIPAPRIQVIHNGISLPTQLPQRSTPGTSLIYVGRLVPEKGVHIILQALQMLASTQEFSFYIVGDGPHRAVLQQQATSLGIDKQVHFCGYQKEVFSLLTQADIFIHTPCWEEGFGLSVVEAMAAGCICVCADSGALSELITHGHDGFLVPKDDPATLAKTLSVVIGENLRHGFATLRRNAIRRAADFSAAQFADQLDSCVADKTANAPGTKKWVIPLSNTPFRMGLLLTMLKTLTAVSGVVPYYEFADDLLSYAAAACFGFSLLCKTYNLQRLIGFASVFLLSLFSAHQSGTLTIVLAVLTCLAFYREDLEKSIAFLFFWEAVYVLFHIGISLILACLGQPPIVQISDQSRWHFGFSHPNVFSVLLINLLCMWIWLHFDGLNRKHLLAVSLVAAIFYCFTGTRSALYAAFILVFLLVLRRREGLLRFGGAVCMIALALAEYGLWKGYLQGSELARSINNILSGRINLAAYALDHFGLCVLGQDLNNISVSWDPKWQISTFTFDDIYSYLAINHGLIWLTGIILLFLRAFCRGSSRNCVFLILWALYGTTETHVINPYLFFPLLLVMEDVTWKK